MPFYRFEELQQETISPHYSTAFGGTVRRVAARLEEFAERLRRMRGQRPDSDREAEEERNREAEGPRA